MEIQLVLLVLVVMAISQLSMIVYFWFLERKWKTDFDRLTVNEAFNEGKQKGYDLLHGAIKKSEAIIGEAELASIKQVADSSHKLSHFQEEAASEIKVTADEVRRQLLAEVAKASQDYKDYLNKLREGSQTNGEQLTRTIAEETEKLMTLFDQRLREGQEKVERESLIKSQEEIENLKKDLEAYKKKRMETIDKEITEVLERTVEIVLGRKLTMNDQMDLVYQALERAKEEKFI